MQPFDLHAKSGELQRAALAAVEPAAAVRRHVRREDDVLVVAGRRYDLREYDHIFVLGGGKAAVPMTTAIADVLGARLAEGVIVTKYGHTRGRPVSDSKFEVIEAGHPMPDENSVRGARAIADLARQAAADDLVMCLISGGGSALLTLPAPGLDLEDLQALTDGLLRSGATINEMNAVRKHCSRIKGGQLARLVAPATLVTLILSDVVGDPLDVIASGPTVPDPTTVADAQAVMERHQNGPFRRVMDRHQNGPFRRVMGRYGKPGGNLTPEAFEFQETPKPGDPAFERVQHVVVGSNRLAALAAVERARELGFNALLLSTYVEGEAREVAQVAAALAKGVRAHGDPLPPPACLVWGGETTVTIRGKGKGGRNQELALAAALQLSGWPGVLMMALATDGTDGPTDAAGAVVTGETIARARALGLDPLAALEANDSYPFFDALGDLLRTGPTGTNVNDLLFILTADEDTDGED